MHVSLLPLIFGEHVPLAAERGISPSSFIELQTSERHALVCSLVNRRGSSKSLSTPTDLQNYLREIDQLIVTATRKIECAGLWSARAYRDLDKLTRCPQAHKFLRHAESITELTTKILHTFPAEWRRPAIVNLVSSSDQARALLSLGHTVGMLFGHKRQEEFRELLERIPEARHIREKFYAFIFRSLDASRLPLATAPFLERVVSYSDCRRLAQMGHCFGDHDMVECVFEADSFFYAWSRRPGVVVEIQKDEFPFSWTVVQARKPKSRPLTTKETEALIADVRGLGVPITSHRLSSRVHAALEHFQ